MSEQNVEWVKGIYGAFSRGDIPTAPEAFADDVEWFEAEGMPYGGLYRSGEAVLQNVFGPIAADVEGFAVTPEEYMHRAQPSRRSSATRAPARQPARPWTSRQSTSGRSGTASWRASGSS
jgi:ketosteroid isomerase-like protein